MAESISWEPFRETISRHLGLEPGEITEMTDIYRDLGLDSLGVVSLGMKLYAVFRVKVPMSAVSEVYTLGDMFRILNTYAVI